LKLFHTQDEAARIYFHSDDEALRQAIIFRGLCAFIEVNGTGEATLEDPFFPKNGSTLYSSWYTRHSGIADLSGWFYVSAKDAARWMHSRIPIPTAPGVWTRAAGQDFIGDFTLTKAHAGPLWFLTSDLEELTAPLQLLPAEVNTQSTSVEKVDEEKPITTKERNNLLRVVAALAKQAGINIGEGKGAATAIEAAVASAGFDGPKEKTIRDILKKAREIE